MSCVVRGCKSYTYPGVKFHYFPNDPYRKKAWLAMVPLKRNFNNSARICSKHFKPEDYDPERPNRLLKTAVPYRHKLCQCCNKLECDNISEKLEENDTTVDNDAKVMHPQNIIKLSYSKKENHVLITIKHVNGSNGVEENYVHNNDIYVLNVNIDDDDNYDEMLDKFDFDDGADDDEGKRCEVMIDEVLVKGEPNLEKEDKLCLILQLESNIQYERDDAKEVTAEANTTKKDKQKATKREKKKKEKSVDRRFRSPKDIEDDFDIDNFNTEEEQREEFKKRGTSLNYLESKFRCEMCLKGFREEKFLSLHMKKHDKSSGDIVCKICLIRVSTLRQYRTHRDLNHLAKYTCRRCDFFTYSKSQARYHRSWHQGVEHKCPHCGMTFRKYTTFMGHVRLVHPSQYICCTCAHSFVNAHGLNHHRKVVHKDQEKNPDAAEKTSCADCDVVFDSYKIYVKHLMMSPRHVETAKTLIACRDCGEEFDNRDLLNIHKQKNEQRALPEENMQKLKICPQCNKQFPHHVTLYHHFVREHPGTPYKTLRRIKMALCDQCGKTFNCRSKLLAHKRLHTGERPYACVSCKKSFRTAQHLASHESCHAGIKSHVCQVCSKAYSSASNLFKHKRIHERVMLFKCEICTKGFVDSSNLRQHIQGVHYNVKRNRRR